MPTKAGRPAGNWLAFAVAAVTLFCSAWIVLPAPAYVLLPLSVGAPEVSSWLGLAAIATVLVALRRVGASGMARATVMLAVFAVALSSVPFLQFSHAVTSFDREMGSAFGAGYLREVPAAARAGWRPRPLVAVDLFRGIPTARVIVQHLPPDAGHGGRNVIVYRPPRAGRYPIIVQIYGGAWRTGTPAENAGFARYLAAHDYVVFAIDYRHAPASRWPAQLDDVRAALDWVNRHGEEFDGDASRIALVGRSSGAQLATIAAWAPGAPRIRAVVSIYGPVDLA
ncbi:MAG: alpha/beta hydrolase, partial [Gemmatimonadales bacterium]|nr:alpha/beta hydrolase [Gemmatimonadales bacterium]